MGNRKINKAISVVDAHLRELKEIDSQEKGDRWKALVRASLEHYLGKSNPLIEEFDKMRFTVKKPISEPGVFFHIDTFKAEKINGFVLFLHGEKNTLKIMVYMRQKQIRKNMTC